MTTQVPTGLVADQAVTTNKLASAAVTADKIAAGAITADKVASGVISPFSAVRQTVQGGPTSSGLPDFLPSSSGTLTLTTQNISSTDPLVVSASQGFGQTSERVGMVTGNTLSWTLSASSGVNYLYVDVATDGTMTTGQTTTAPVYSRTLATGTNTFNMTTMTMYTSGTTKGWRVFIGEATAGVGSISGVIAYAYNGRYISTPAVLTMSQITTANCNIGSPFEVCAKLICKTSEYGYLVGDEIDSVLWYAGAYYGGNTFARNNATDGNWKKCGIAMSAYLNIVYDASTNNTSRTLTSSNWYTQFVCRRKF